MIPGTLGSLLVKNGEDAFGVAGSWLHPAPTDAAPRPLTVDEAQNVFDAMAARGDTIAFRYLYEGCESRSQLMIEAMIPLGVDPGRAWAVSVGRPLAVANPAAPKGPPIKWYNHTAPTVAVDATLQGVRVIDPSIPGTTSPLTVSDWAASIRAKSVEISLVPLTQAEILELQRVRALAGQVFDAVLFLLARGVAPIPDKGGSGFRIDPDPPQGVSAFAHAEMQRFLAAQRLLWPGVP